MINRILWATLAVAVGCVGFAGQAAADEAEMRAMVQEAVKAEMAAQKKDDLRVYWKDGLRLDNADKSIQLKIGGRVMADYNFFVDAEGFEQETTPPLPADSINSGFEFRRVRLYNSGVIHDHVEYKVQFDFAGGDVSFRDAYFGIRDLSDCWGCAFPDVRLGSQMVPIGMESNQSSKYITFMERSAVVNTFGYPSRVTGVKVHDSLMGDHLNYGFAYFAPTSDPSEGGDYDLNDGYGLAARVTYAPWWDCDCKCLRWHVGASAAYYGDLSGRRWRSRSSLHKGNRVLDTGTIADVDSYWTFGLETALVYGPWSIQAEYMMNPVDSVIADDPTFSGWYVYASYFLTGECRNYKHGNFSRVKPCCNFLDNDCCCSGAWELTARVQGLDLADGNIDGGELFAWTVGVNWYLNPNVRIMLNFTSGTVDGTPRGFDGDGAMMGLAPGSWTFDDQTLSAVGIRFQVDW